MQRQANADLPQIVLALHPPPIRVSIDSGQSSDTNTPDPDDDDQFDQRHSQSLAISQRRR
jgi:hypothetical protein